MPCVGQETLRRAAPTIFKTDSNPPYGRPSEVPLLRTFTPNSLISRVTETIFELPP